MANFCRKCGSRLDKSTGLCPNCDAEKIKQHYDNLRITETSVQKQKMILRLEEPSGGKDTYKKRKIDKKSKKRELKAQKKADKKVQRDKWSKGKKIRRFFLKLILIILFLSILAVGLTGTLVYFHVIDIPFLSNLNQNSLLEFINKRNIIVEEKSIVMTSDTEGTAIIVVKIPDYELLFKNAAKEENPDQYLLMSLILKDYKTQEFEMAADITIENGERIIHSDEVVHQLLEESLVNAVNAVSEVK